MAESELERTFATHVLWRRLPTPEREYRFHPQRKWRFDFCWPVFMVAVEIEGGTWVSGAHGRGVHFESDAEKYDEAAILGYRVLRFTNKMVEDGRAIEFTIRALHAVQADRTSVIRYRADLTALAKEVINDAPGKTAYAVDLMARPGYLDG